MWSLRIAVAIALAAALAGCGFHPLYGQRAGRAVLNELAAVDVSPLTDRLGIEVYNNLRDGLSPEGARARSRYRLSVNLNTSQTGLITEKDSQVRRFDLSVNASYELRDVRTGTALLKSSAHAVASYNVVETANFATLTAEQDAALRAGREVSKEIVAALSLFFERRMAGGGQSREDQDEPI